MSNVFNDFSNRLNDIAVEWPSDQTALKSEPATREAFEEAATLALLTLKASDPERFTRFKLDDDTEAGAHYSMRLMNRFMFLSAIAAAKKGYTVTDLAPIMRNPKSIDYLTVLAKQYNKVAGRTEAKFNLKGKGHNYYGDDLQAVEEVYDVKDGSVALEGFNTELLRHAVHVDTQMRETYSTEEYEAIKKKRGCLAHKAEALVPIYKSLVLIGLKDPSLATAVMSLSRESLMPKPKEKPQQKISVPEFLMSQDAGLAQVVREAGWPVPDGY